MLNHRVNQSATSASAKLGEAAAAKVQAPSPVTLLTENPQNVAKFKRLRPSYCNAIIR